MTLPEPHVVVEIVDNETLDCPQCGRKMIHATYALTVGSKAVGHYGAWICFECDQ